jgi:hypothetical protein
MNFFRSIYKYISSKLKFRNNSYENMNETIYNDNTNNTNSFDNYDQEYEVFISNIHNKNESSK